MNQNLSISKLPPPFQSMDYEALRLEGMKYIERLSSAIWTDYNVHDPGITMLEAICYAITDLGYRTEFSIENLLAGEDGALSGQFFTAAQILTNNPLTVTDYRKLLIDIDGIRNAWLRVATESEMAIFANYEHSELDLNEPSEKHDKLQLNGLYKVLIDLDQEQEELDQDQVKELLKKAYRRLHEHRNLCEDFLCVEVVEEQEVRLCAEIEVENDANLEDILAHIYFELDRFMNPSVPFYSLEQLFEKNKTSEEIFDGLVLEHGFIDSDDLARSDLRTEIHGSDLYRLIMDIEGVSGIKRLVLFNYDKNGIQTERDNWILPIPPGHKPVWKEEQSVITFYKDGLIPFKANKEKARAKAVLLEELDIKARLVGPQRDIPLPRGQYMELDDYTRLRENFPDTYGVNSNGLPRSSSPLRQAQARQLKGYLMFFDQLLANYLSQLYQVKNLLAVNQDYDSTYFAHHIFESAGIEGLFDSGTTMEDILECLEDTAGRNARANRFLDHLLARFNESFGDYALLMYQLSGADSQPTAEALIEDKKAFLNAYPEISRDRARAFNYTQRNSDDLPDSWDTDNVSGLKKRVARLLGLEDYQRKSLLCPKKLPKVVTGLLIAQPVLFDPQVKLQYQISLYGQDKTELLKSLGSYSDENLSDSLLKFQQLVGGEEYYQIVSPIKQRDPSSLVEGAKLVLPGRNINVSVPFRFLELLDTDGKVIARSPLQKTEAAARLWKEQILSLVAEEEGKLKQVILSSVKNPSPPPPYKLEMRIEDSDGTELFTDEKLYDNSPEAREAVFDILMTGEKAGKILPGASLGPCTEDCSIEGFFVVEHILLRPMNRLYQAKNPGCTGLLPVDIDTSTCDCCEGLKDPYSFRISVVLPAWPERFKDMNFRRYFERALRLETPAHIALKICWVNCEQLEGFEKAYKNWLVEKAEAYRNFESWLDQIDLEDTNPCPGGGEKNLDEDALADATRELVCSLFQLKNVYPGARFHDCRDDESGGGIILNNSILG